MDILKKQNPYAALKPARIPAQIPGIFALLTLVAALYAGIIGGRLPSWSVWSTPLLFLITVICCFVVMPRNFTVGFLVGTLALLIGWRASAIAGAVPVMVLSGITCVLFVLQFIDCAFADMKQIGRKWTDTCEWQVTFLRIYFGFDMVGHCTEKLFAGYDSYVHMTQVFTHGWPHGLISSVPAPLVVVGGLCELGICIGIGMGLFTRLAAAGATLYFALATLDGGHLFDGYTWNNTNGGWEYCLMMMAFYVSFVFTGSGKFSLDGWLLGRFPVPKVLRVLMTPQKSPFLSEGR